MNEIPDFLNQGYQALRELRRNEEGGRVIYQARTVNLDQEVAIEEYRFALAETSREAFKAYQRLLEMLQGIDNPGLPLYLDAFETASGFCLVREYIKAPSLAELPELKPKAIAHLALSVLDILVELQNSSPLIVHRNICPENILVRQSDRDLSVTLVDFGLPAFGEEASASSIVPGIPGFVPPEALFQKPLSRASDLYSLGATLICLFTGTPSTEIGNLIDDNLQLKFQAKLSHIEPALIPWLEKMVSANVKKRYENAAAAKAALERILAGQGQSQGQGASTKAKNSDNIVRLRIPAAPLRLASLGAIVFLSMNFITSCQGGPVKRLLATKECSECHLREAQLESAYLEGAKLQGSDLEEAKLQNAYLEGANLVGANLRSADLEQAKLEGANMEGSKLQGTNLHGANLDEVNLEGANLEGANLQGAKLKNAKLEGVNLKGANLEGANLEGANLEGAILERVNLENAILIRINLERADLRNAKLRKAKLESANLKDAKLEDADLREAHLVRAHLKDAKLEDASLEKANLEDANLEGVKLEDANLEDANLEGANLEGANLEDAYLRGADLSNGNLQRAKLEGANLQGANLEDVNLEGAYLGNVNLKDANLKGAKLEGVNLKDANLDDAKIEDAKIETPPEETKPPEPSQ